MCLPAQAQKTSIERGYKVFKALNCEMCHPGGDNAMEPAKPIHGAAFLKRYPDDEAIARRIREGSPSGIMPPFRKDVLTDQQLVDVIAYIRSLSTKTKTTATATQKKSACPPLKAPTKQPQAKGKKSPRD